MENKLQDPAGSEPSWQPLVSHLATGHWDCGELWFKPAAISSHLQNTQLNLFLLSLTARTSQVLGMW